MKKLKRDGAPRMSITVDIYDREVFEGLNSLALLARKSKSEYLREVLTEHYNRKRAAII